MTTFAVYGTNKADEMSLLKRDLREKEAINLADTHWRTTKCSAVIIKQED